MAIFTRFRPAVVAGVLFCAPDFAQAQGFPFTEFDSILGFYHPDVLIENGDVIGEDVVRRLGRVSAAMQAAVANEIANLSISAAGTQYFFGPDRMFYVSGNMGTFYIEPPWTTGAGNGSMSVNTSYLKFETFQGQDLDEIFDFDDENGVRVWEGDYELEGQLTTLSMTFGLTDRLDFGVILPMVHLEGEGQGEFALISGIPPITDFSESDTTLADIFFRLKYELIEVEDMENLFTWSVGLDLKANNGDQDRLLGTGDVGYRFRTSVGRRYGRVYPVLEIAYYFAGVDVKDKMTVQDAAGNPVTFDTGIDDKDFNAFEAKFGLPVALIEERWTLALEWLHSSSDFAVTNDVGVTSRLKLNDQLFLQGGLRIPLDDQGLRTDLVPTIGGEFRF